MADLLPDQLRNRDRERRNAYRTNLAFYEGRQWTNQRDRRRRLTFNYCRAIITKATSYLMKDRTVTVAPDGDSDEAAAAAADAELAINAVWDQNNLNQLDFDTELDCAVLGDAGYKTTWDPIAKRVRISAPDPAGVFAWRWPDDPSRVWRVASQYQLDHDSVLAVTGVDPPAIAGRQRTHTITEDWTSQTFQLWIDKTLARDEPNPYGFVPFVLFPNLREPKREWGTSDVDQLIEPQRELNRVVTQTSKILELSGNPIAVLEGITEAQDIAVVPGAIWEIPTDAKASTLDLLKGGGIRLHIDFLDKVYRAMHDLGETPRAAFGDTNRDLSGVALELELDPLIKKVDRKRLIRTDAYRQRNTQIIALLNAFAGMDLGEPNHSIAWGSILPTDRDRLVRDEVALVNAAIHSRNHAADALGHIHDPASEFQRVLEEEAAIAAVNTAAP